MIDHRFRSLQLRLAVRLAALFIVGTAAIVGIFVFRAYATADADIFAVRGNGGKLISALPAEFGQVIERWPEASDDPSYFHLQGFGARSQDYYGLGISFDSAAGPLSIWVARATGADALVHSLLREFVLDIAWVIPLFVLLTLFIGVLA